MKCKICDKDFFGLKCTNKWCNQEYIECDVCKNVIPEYESYSYRNGLSCETCLDKLQNKIDYERQQIINEENKKLINLKGLDFGENPVGKENRKLLKTQLEIAQKETNRIKIYEKRK